MRGEFSWLVLVAAFVGVTAACGLLMARLLRTGDRGSTVNEEAP
jgi:hypothetical protein